MFNSEVWNAISEASYIKLQDIYELYFRRIINVIKTVPKESIYITFGVIPIKYIIMKRRLMYWWHLNNVNKKELIYKIYNCQKLKMQKNDWSNSVNEDVKELKPDIEEEELSNVSKEKFKKYINKKVEDKVKEIMENKKKIHSKSKSLPVFNGNP